MKEEIAAGELSSEIFFSDVTFSCYSNSIVDVEAPPLLFLSL